MGYARNDRRMVSRVISRYAGKKPRVFLDVNKYSKALTSLKTVDPLIASLVAVSKKFEGLAKTALKDFAKMLDELPEKLKGLGVDTKTLKRYHTQAVNLVKIAQEGQPLRAYSTYSSESPGRKARDVLGTLARAALKLAGDKADAVKDYFNKEVSPAIVALSKACDGWYTTVSPTCSKIDTLSSAARFLSKAHKGFVPDPEFDEYIKAQNDFVKEMESPAYTVQHTALGLQLAPSSFEDCLDVDLCLKTMQKAYDDLMQLFEAFWSKWEKYITSNGGQ